MGEMGEDGVGEAYGWSLLVIAAALGWGWAVGLLWVLGLAVVRHSDFGCVVVGRSCCIR